MQLHCLGTAGYHPNESRHTSCYFLPAAGIILDCGSGAFRLAELIRTRSLDVLLSHAHLDHIVGLTFLLDVLYQCERRNCPVETIRVWGEAKKLSAVRDHLLSDLVFPAPIDCQWNAIDQLPSFSVGDSENASEQASVSWRPQQHPGGSVAFRLDWPASRAVDSNNRDHDPASPSKSLVYASDTVGDVSDDHANWSKHADLLMHECYFRNADAAWAEKTGHSWTDRVIEVASKSKPHQLLLTHINPIETVSDPLSDPPSDPLSAPLSDPVGDPVSDPVSDPVEMLQIQEKLTSKVVVAADKMVVEF